MSFNKIMITNDDGLNAKGLNELMQALKDDYELSVVAPKHNMSATSHSVSLDRLITVKKMDCDIPVYEVDGTPSDCVKLAISELGIKPDLIISGINQGANTGISVIYSGTVAAAREGAINGIPSLAVSLCGKNYEHYDGSLHWLLKILNFLKTKELPRDLLLNVCVPPIDQKNIAGLKFVHQAESKFVEEFIPQESKNADKRSFRLAGHIEVSESTGTSDEELVKQGFVTVTPLKLDITDYELIRDWGRRESDI